MASAFWHLLTLDLCQYHTVCEYWFKTIVEALMSWALKYICDLRNSSLIAKAQQTPGVHQISVSWLLWWKQWPLTLACVCSPHRAAWWWTVRLPGSRTESARWPPSSSPSSASPPSSVLLCVSHTPCGGTHTYTHTLTKNIAKKQISCLVLTHPNQNNNLVIDMFKRGYTTPF